MRVLAAAAVVAAAGQVEELKPQHGVAVAAEWPYFGSDFEDCGGIDSNGAAVRAGASGVLAVGYHCHR